MFNLLLFENIDFLNYLDFRCLRAALLYNWLKVHCAEHN